MHEIYLVLHQSGKPVCFCEKGSHPYEQALNKPMEFSVYEVKIGEIPGSRALYKELRNLR
jgi:hypothetical protein